MNAGVGLTLFEAGDKKTNLGQPGENKQIKRKRRGKYKSAKGRSFVKPQGGEVK